MDTSLATQPPSVPSVGDAPDPLAFLSADERSAYQRFAGYLRRGGSESYPLAPDVNARLFDLYLRGRSLREIMRLGAGAYTLGQVVHAAVEGQWDRRRIEVLDEMILGAAETARRAAVEGVEYLADSIAAAAKIQRERVSKFLRTGDMDDAPDVASVATFAKLVESLVKLTGADRTQRKAAPGTIDHRMVPMPVPQDDGDRAARLKKWGDAEAAKKSK